uniref:uncharacterized protein LOC122580660 n=1 Tax=Erigeron canadensis TaxID=72917 RepID=UPI001CB93763|nr:uncharacterized protein LOC122580660 [Erigeron canadensis]
MDDIPEVFYSSQPFYQDPFMNQSQHQNAYYPDPYVYTTETHNPNPYMYHNPDPYMYIPETQNPDPSMNDKDYLIDQGFEDFLPYITQVQNVLGDGNCGFRAAAFCIGRHQDDWRQIRMDLLDELFVHNARYTAIFNKEDVQSLQYMLNHFEGGFADPQYWMTMLETGLLIASRYNVVVVFLSKDGETTCFPLFTSLPSSQPHDICVIGRVNHNHFVRLVLQGDFPVPPTHPQ